MEKRQKIERVRVQEVDPTYELFGEPFFLNNGERRVYLRLRSAIERVLEPTALFEFQDVAEIAYDIVSVQRYRKAQVTLINSPVVLAELLQFVFVGNADKARNVALHYFSDDGKKADAAAELIRTAGITSDQIDGHAIVSQSQKIRELDALIQIRQSSALRREQGVVKRRATLKSLRDDTRSLEVRTDTTEVDGSRRGGQPRHQAGHGRNLSVVKK